MFPDSKLPRLFGLPPGSDFATQLVDGILHRTVDLPPEYVARITVFVNTRRMQRRIREVFDAGPACLLPRVRLITDLSLDPTASHLPPPVSPIRRRLEISQLVARLLEKAPDLAPKSALYDLSDSLGTLIDEMQGEGVTPETIAALDVTDFSGHWARSLSFLQIVQGYFDGEQEAPDRESRQRQVILNLIEKWRSNPPCDPIIIAGSTGSRGSTALLMEAVSKLPQGAVVLPGFDYEMPQNVWDQLGDSFTAEDHPQTRFCKLMSTLQLTPTDVALWTNCLPSNPARNSLVSLALRPAPVTDQWLSDGPKLGDLRQATQGMTMVEAPSPRIEAEAIALRLRKAIDEGITAALITPDRMLTRQVSAMLDRWNIQPDDSAGIPLPLSPPGRFLRQISAMLGQSLSAESLLSLLKHPLCNSGDDRNTHLLRTREFELHIRHKGPSLPNAKTLISWAKKTAGHDIGRVEWVAWLGAMIEGLEITPPCQLSQHLKRHIALAEAWSAGPFNDGSGTLWDKAAGRTARSLVDELTLHADAGGIVSAQEYTVLFNSVLNGAEVRDRDKGHPNILIWGTLEARVQSADLIILAGMNEGVWPESPAPDPWLNRTMRAKAGLLMPERRIGLSAHDFTLAVAGKEVWVTRSIRSDESETVPSRWVNRLLNLLKGLPDQHGPEAIATMNARGQKWIASAIALSDTPMLTPAIRPSPRPPVQARPKQLSVTAIAKLIRDPYSIYARHILKLFPLRPLSPEADASLRGIVMHKIFETFIKNGPDPCNPDARKALIEHAQNVLLEECPWPTSRHLWLGHIDRIAGWFLKTEIARRLIAEPTEFFEVRGQAEMTDLDFRLTAIADRIDLTKDGKAVIYDYKTGIPPNVNVQKHYEKQLLLEAALVEKGGYTNLKTKQVHSAVYIGIGASPCEISAPLEGQPPEVVWSELHNLIRSWQDPDRGYSARIAPQLIKYESDYDQLSRYGEWDDSTPITPEDVK